MQVIQINESFPFTPHEERPGIHVTQIIHYIEKQLGKDRGEIDDVARLRMEMGFVWEAALEAAYKDRLGIRPGAVELDGIIGSPDGIDDAGRVEEYKLTWSSSRTAIDQRWRWMQQTMAYCHMCGTDTAVFRVLYLNGDYKTREPIYQVTEIKFTPQEIDTCWQMLVNHAKMLKEDA